MSSQNFTVAPPRIVDRHVRETLFCGPGPANMWPSVNEAITRDLICNMCDEFFNVMDDIRAGIQYLFQTQRKLVLAMSGSGHSGMEAVICNLVAPGETLLIAKRGMWDLRADIIARRYGIKTVVEEIPVTETFSFDHLESMIKKVRPTALFITHGDSSTGSVQKIEGLGQICHKYGVLLLVDTVVSIAAEPFFMDAWEVDAVYSSPQKAMSGPAGISPVAFSALAENKINNRKHEPPFYFDIKELALQWNCYENARKYHHTVSTPMLWALRCCLQEIAKETLQKSWERHAAVNKYFNQRLGELPVTFLIANPEDRLSTVTTISLPKGYEYLEVIKYMREKHDILIFGGMGPTAGKILRIGVMGVNSSVQIADRLVAALADTLKGLKKSSL
ncbi:alanine--glyoxylate aminotransferase isoform X2 [Ostrinia nubilalis]